MKKLFVIITIIFLISIVYSDNASFKIKNIKNDAYNMLIEYNEVLWERKLNTYGFITEYIPKTSWKKNMYLLDHVENDSDLEYKLDKVLKDYVKDKKSRQKLISGLELPEYDAQDLKMFKEDVNELINTLRVRENKGKFKYAYYGLSGEKVVTDHNIRVMKEKNTPQVFGGKLDDIVYKIRFYSKSKVDIFTGNRDSFISSIDLFYYENGIRKKYSKVIDKWLKRGQYFELIFDKPLSSPEYKLYFGTKKEHTRKAYLGFEFYRSEIQDDTANPNFELIQRLKKINTLYTSSYKEELDNVYNIISNLPVYNPINNPSDIYVQEKPEFEEKENLENSQDISKDKLQYYYYILQDKNNDRDFILDKFKELFDL